MAVTRGQSVPHKDERWSLCGSSPGTCLKTHRCPIRQGTLVTSPGQAAPGPSQGWKPEGGSHMWARAAHPRVDQVTSKVQETH